MSSFTHLHLHSQYSILDGAANISTLLDKAKEYGMKAVAITDHGNMFGAYEFFDGATKKGIKPIIGCEMYVAEGSRFDKKGKDDRSGYHLILLAKNEVGYHNLMKLSSLAYKKEAFYYTPRIDKDLLREYHTGLIASSACLGGEIPYTINNFGYEKAEIVLQEYVDIFGDDFYLEMQRHGIPDQTTANEGLIKLSKQYNVKLIASNDVHFINKEDSDAHRILICLNTGRDFNDNSSMIYTGNEYFRSTEEMEELFADIPEAITNTQEIVDKIENYSLKRDIILPKFEIPEEFDNEDEYLKYLTYQGAEKLYPEITEELKDRMIYELKVLSDKKFSGYLLIVQDFIKEARKMDVLVGPGRGSAAGSVVAFCIGITTIDPIKYKLLFERFLNPERPGMPDIDVDFDDDGREKVLKYVVEKYGENKVAQIITFGTMAAKTSIRDVARVIKLPLQDADRLAKLVPEKPGTTLKQAYKDSSELRGIREAGSEMERRTLTFAETLEGSTRHTGTHACGVIIGPDDLTDYIPLCTSKDTDMMISQFEGKKIEEVGMLKMDFLGLKTLSIVKDTILNIYKRTGKHIDIETIPLEDKASFEIFQKGDTIGIFQFESEGMRANLKLLKPTSIEDLIAMNALYRPGPMDYIPSYINRKHNREKVNYAHPLVEEILKDTFGIMVYQEQIMKVGQVMGGYTLGGADILRRAMGKKDVIEMEEQKAIFLKGANEKGIDTKIAESVFDDMLKFANYGFNRSHSAAYSVLSFKTAYLKAHYKADYLAAVLTHNLNDLKKITFFIDECKRNKINVCGPDVNESDLKFFVNKKEEIRFGLSAIKGVGEMAASSIIEERQLNGPYNDIFDFIKRSNLRTINKRAMEALALSGAFDGFTDMHRAMFFHKDVDNTNFIEKLLKFGNTFQQKTNSNQVSLFGGEQGVYLPLPNFPKCDHYHKLEQLKREKEAIGFYISGSPLDDFAIAINHFCNTRIDTLNSDIEKHKDREVTFAGIITAVAHKMTKNNKPFGSFTIEDFNGNMTLNIFSEDYLNFKKYFIPDLAIFIRARIEKRYKDSDRYELRIVQVLLLSEVLEKYVKQIYIDLPLDTVSEVFIAEFKEFINNNKGESSLIFRVIHDKIILNMLANKYKVNPVEFLKILELNNYNYHINNITSKKYN